MTKLKNIREFAGEIRPLISDESYKKIYNNNLHKLLREKNIFHSEPELYNKAYDKYIEAGYFVSEHMYFENDKRYGWVTRITEKGHEWLFNGLMQSGILEARTDEYKEIEWNDCDVKWFVNNYNEDKHMAEYYELGWKPLKETSLTKTFLRVIRHKLKMRYCEK